MGRYRTLSLFIETAQDTDEALDPIWTLKNYDHTKGDKIYPSLKRIYLSYNHIPGFEYDFAVETFGAWEHWLKLCKSSKDIRVAIQAWREELDVRIKSKAMKQMMIASLDDDAKGVNAAKYLADKGYEPKRGRPSKEEVARQTKIDAGVNKDLEDDMSRLGLKVVQGSK